MVYYQIEPFGGEAQFLGHAITASTVYNMLRDPRKTKAAKPEDFIPKFEEAMQECELKSPEELWLNFKTWAMAFGGEKHGNTR